MTREDAASGETIERGRHYYLYSIGEVEVTDIRRDIQAVVGDEVRENVMIEYKRVARGVSAPASMLPDNDLDTRTLEGFRELIDLVE